MKITQEIADEMLASDLFRYEESVRKTCNYLTLNQNQFDALVSFTYNCGAGSLLQLTKNKTRTTSQIADHIEAYNKGAGGVVLAGLTRRRKEEKELFLMADIPEVSIIDKEAKIKEIMNVDGNTMFWFECYKYGTPYLIDKMYAVCVDAEKWRNQAKK